LVNSIQPLRASDRKTEHHMPLGRVRLWRLLLICSVLGIFLLKGAKSADPNDRTDIEFSEDEYKYEYEEDSVEMGEGSFRGAWLYHDDPDYYDNSPYYGEHGLSEAHWSLEFQSRMYIYFFAIFLFIFLLVTLAVGHFTWFRELQTKLEREWLEQVRREATSAAAAEIERSRSGSSGAGANAAVSIPNKADAVSSPEDHQAILEGIEASPVIPTPVSLARPSSSAVSCGEMSDTAWDVPCDGALCQPPHRHSILCPRNGRVPRLNEPIQMLGLSSGSDEDEDEDEDEDGWETHATAETASYLEARNAARTQSAAASAPSLPTIFEPGLLKANIYGGVEMQHNSMPDLEAPRPVRRSCDPARGPSQRTKRNNGTPAPRPFLDISKIDLI
jgi:hypothetical protein